MFIKKSPQSIICICKKSFFKNILSLILLCTIDAVERLSRIALIFVFLHFVISYSEYSNFFELSKYGSYEFVIYFTLILVYFTSSFYQHRYILNEDKFKYDLVINARCVFQYFKIIYSPHYFTFNRSVILGSTLLQYLGLLVLPLFVGYTFLSAISFLIILLSFLINLVLYEYTKVLQRISITLSQTILFLMHLALISLYSLYSYQNIDIFVIIYLFALRLCLLYMGQLVEYSVGFFVNAKQSTSVN